MSIEQQTTLVPVRRRLTRILVASTAVALLVAPGIASAGDDDSEKTDEEQIAEAVAVQHKLVEAFNARKSDELGALYVEDAIAIPPNHEPIKGRAAIVEYWRSIRDTIGEGKCGEPLDGVASGKYVATVSRDCSAYSGNLGFTTHELLERQSDGTLRYKFDMFGMR